MTIYKPKKGEKKEDSGVPAPEVVTEPLVTKDDLKKAGLLLPPPPQSPTLVAITARRRHGSCANVCVFLTALVVLGIGIIGGVYLYKHLTHRTYQGWCGVDYYETDYSPESSQAYGERRRFRGHLEEHVEIDNTYGHYERIEVPEIDECQKAVIVHDFEKNLTAIIDETKGHCFIKPLNRSNVKPPEDFWDLLLKIKTGYYLPDAEVVRDRYRVLTPAVHDLEPYGYFIWRECRRYETYELERVSTEEPVAMVKRDVYASNSLWYSEGSSGNSLVKDELFFKLE